MNTASCTVSPSSLPIRRFAVEGHRIDLKTLDDNIHTMDVGLAWKDEAKFSPAARAFFELVARSYPG